MGWIQHTYIVLTIVSSTYHSVVVLLICLANLWRATRWTVASVSHCPRRLCAQISKHLKSSRSHQQGSKNLVELTADLGEPECLPRVLLCTDWLDSFAEW